MKRLASLVLGPDGSVREDVAGKAPLEVPAQRTQRPVLVHNAFEGFHYPRIELRSGVGPELLPGSIQRQGRAVHAIAGHGAEGVGYSNDASAERNGGTRDGCRVATTVPSFVVVAHDLGDLRHGLVHIQNGGADLAVAAHLGHLVVGQTAGFEKHGIGDADLADVVQVAPNPNRHLLPLVQAQHGSHSLR